MRGVRRLRDLPTPRTLTGLDTARLREVSGLDAATTRALQRVARAAASEQSTLWSVAAAPVDAIGPTLLRALRRDVGSDAIARLRRWSTGGATIQAATTRPRMPSAS